MTLFPAIFHRPRLAARFFLLAAEERIRTPTLTFIPALIHPLRASFRFRSASSRRSAAEDDATPPRTSPTNGVNRRPHWTQSWRTGTSPSRRLSMRIHCLRKRSSSPNSMPTAVERWVVRRRLAGVMRSLKRALSTGQTSGREPQRLPMRCACNR